MSKAAKEPATGHLMSFGDHLDELRHRVVRSLIGVVPVFIAAMYFGKSVLNFLIRPVQDELRAAGQPASMQSTGVLETFGAYFHVSIIVTILVGSPWILWQLWKFVAPGLHHHERRFVYFLLPLSTVLTLSGIALLYLAIVPAMLRFFIPFGADIGLTPATVVQVAPEIDIPTLPILDGDPASPQVGMVWVNKVLQQSRVCVGMDGTVPIILGTDLVRGAGISQNYRVNEYIQLFLTLALAFAVAFQMPVVVLLLGWAGIIDRPWLARYRRHALLLCGVLSALLTPGDPTSLVMLWIPLFGLYELGGLLLKYFPARRVAGKSLVIRPGEEDL